MEILSSHAGGIQALHLIGNFDATAVETFRAHVEESIDARRFRVLVDAEQVRFINLAAFRSLIRAQKRLQQYGGDLAIATLPSFASGVFKTVGLDRKIRCFDAADQAQEYLCGVGTEGFSVDGEQEVGFTFSGAEQIAAAGEEPRMGTMKRIGEFGMQFEGENLDGLDSECIPRFEVVVER